MAENRPITVVDANSKSASNGLSTLWNYRELLGSLSRRDFRVRFVQTRLGYVWAIIQPLFLIAILTFLFSKVLSVNTGHVPYPLFALSGQILWSFFSYSAVQGGQSLVQAQHMIRKIWFPRIVLPFSKAGVGLIDLAIGLVLLLALMPIFNMPYSTSIALILLAVLFTVVAGMGISLWTSSLGIKYRDIQHALPYVIQFLFFLTPVAYPSGILGRAVGESNTWIAYLNPMAGPIDIARYGLFGSEINSSHVSISCAIAFFVLVSGWIYFHKVERNMADTL